MDGSGFDALAKDIGGVVSRRGVLYSAAMGTLGLGLGFAATLDANAKKKKKRSRKKGDPNALCKRQVAECEDVLSQACFDDEECLTTVQTCCPSLGNCNFGAFSACLLVNQL